MKVNTIKPNPKNPRIIKDDSFKKLCKSIQDFPKMMTLRPIVVDDSMMVLGGNMRLKALQHLKINEIPDEWVKKASKLTDEEKQRFIISDNVSGGEWDYDILANEWNADDLKGWGVELPVFGSGDIIELDNIVTTFNINIKCETPGEVEDLKQKLGITSNNISYSILLGLLR